MDVIRNATLPLAMLDHLAREILGASSCGVSVGGGRSRIHLVDANPAHQQRCADMLSHFDALQLSASASSLNAGAADPVIRCSDAALGADSDIGYLVTLDDEVYASGRDKVVSGAIALTLRDPAPGDYAVFVFRLRGNYASGTQRIRVEEA